LDAIAEREEGRRVGRRDVRGHLVDDGVRVDVEVLAVAAPEGGPEADGCSAVANLAAARPAEAIVVRPAVLARPARDVLLEADPIALLDLPLVGGLLAGLMDDPEVFVAHDVRRPGEDSA